jgi:hypothetical protein
MSNLKELATVDVHCMSCEMRRGLKNLPELFYIINGQALTSLVVVMKQTLQQLIN